MKKVLVLILASGLMSGCAGLAERYAANEQYLAKLRAMGVDTSGSSQSSAWRSSRISVPKAGGGTRAIYCVSSPGGGVVSCR